MLVTKYKTPFMTVLHLTAAFAAAAIEVYWFIVISPPRSGLAANLFADLSVLTRSLRFIGAIIMLGKCVNYLRVVSWWRVDSLVAISFVAKWSGGEVTGFRFI